MTLNLRRLLIGAIAVLLAVLVLEWVLPDGTASDAAVPPPHLAARGAGQPVMARDTSQWVETVLARPLFSISRRPPKVAARAGGAAAAPAARLAGIMITRYGRRAIFAPDGGGKQLVLPEGANVNESTIRSIKPDSVVMASGAVLRPAFDKSGRSQATTLPASFTTPPFQPPGFPPAYPAQFPAPGLPGQGFQGQGFPGQGFQGQGFPGQGFPGQGFQGQGFQGQGGPASQANIQPGSGTQAAGGDDAPPTMPPPGLRNPMIPQRRE